MVYPSFHTNKVPFTLIIGVVTSRPQEIRVQAKDSLKPLTYYVNHKGMVNKRMKDGKYYREFQLKFPQVPSQMTVGVFNTAFGNLKKDVDKSFTVTKFEAKPLVSKIPYDVWINEADASFIKFAKRFCDDASINSASMVDPSGKITPSVYHSDDLKYVINYYNVIVDSNNKVVNTPARIGHDSGRIDASKECFIRYTVPMRMIILLHEYSHKYKNNSNGFDIKNEITADIAALNMYLSLGYSEIEAIQAFATVFKGADTEQNRKRLLIIRDFITKFLSGTLPTLN